MKLRKHVILTSCIFVLCQSVVHSQGPEPKEELDLSRETFIREMVIASRTEVTHEFQDTHPLYGTYHVDKLDLIKAVRSLADSTTKDVVAVLILGPMGPLWEYRVVTVIDSSDSDSAVSVNHLVFPHARITFKSTMSIGRLGYDQIMDRIQSNPLLQTSTDIVTLPNSWDVAFVLATYGEDMSFQFVSDSVARDNQEALDQLYHDFNKLIVGDSRKTTYDPSSR